MSALEFQFHDGGIYFPHLRLWLDPKKRKEELVFVSHAHSDHVANHREVIVSAPTARLMAVRLGGKRIALTPAFGERQALRREGVEYHLTLLSAGHIFGSAMALIECAGESLLYTGDFKLCPSLSCPACEPRRADVLIMETTFGQPRYRLPAAEEVMTAVIQFCREAVEQGETPILHCYSLGKSQEVLCRLADAGLPILLHGATHKMTKVYEEFGHRFPPYEALQAGAGRGKVVICPPGAARSMREQGLGPTRRAVLTGWAVDRSCRFRYQCDAAFPLSDHADYDELIELVQLVRPRRIYTLHGFAADFAAALRGLGFEASALGEDEQLTLGLVMAVAPPPRLALSDPDCAPS